MHIKVGWVVNKFHNTIEQNRGFTFIPTSMSPSKDQHFDGFHVIKAENAKKDRQPSMHTNLETLRLKHLQATTLDCNMAFGVKMQLYSNMTSSPHDTSS
jgi:hypothetical protein